MTDITTRYLGITLKNPIIAASSGLTGNINSIIELEKSGIGAIVLKSIFEEEILAEFNRELHQLDRFKSNLEYLDYYDYQIKEENIGKYLSLIKEAKKNCSIPIIASINCKTATEWPVFAKKLVEAGVDAIELNVFIMPSDIHKPSSEIEDNYIKIAEKVIKNVSVPVAVKMSKYFTNTGYLANKLVKTGVSGIVMFNRFYNPDIDIQKLTVASANVLSTPEELSHTLRWTALLSPVIDTSISASTGVHSAEAVIKLILAGADTVQLASVLYNNGVAYASTIINELQIWMEKNQFSSLAQFKGKLNHEKTKNPSDFERVQFMKYFSERD